MSPEVEVVVSALVIGGILMWKSRRKRVKKAVQKPAQIEPPLSNAELKAMERWFNDDDGPSNSP